MNKEIHYVYQITNLINGKYYIGKHSTDDIDDNYFGSGTLLRAAFKKYGKGNFEKYVLQFCDTEEDAYKLEGELVTTDQINDPMCYNMTTGGLGAGSGEGSHRYGKTHSDETKIKMGVGHKGRRLSEKHIAEITSRNSKRVAQKDKLTGRIIRIFNSASEATRFLHKRGFGSISNCATGKRKTAYGYKWEYVN